MKLYSILTGKNCFTQCSSIILDQILYQINIANKISYQINIANQVLFIILKTIHHMNQIIPGSRNELVSAGSENNFLSLKYYRGKGK